jgi:hypothetical protein
MLAMARARLEGPSWRAMHANRSHARDQEGARPPHLARRAQRSGAELEPQLAFVESHEQFLARARRLELL